MKNPLDLHLIYLHQKQQKIEKHKNCFKILQERRHVVVIESGKGLTNAAAKDIVFPDLVTLHDDDDERQYKIKRKKSTSGFSKS
jgi:hypothetical protein